MLHGHISICLLSRCWSEFKLLRVLQKWRVVSLIRFCFKGVIDIYTQVQLGHTLYEWSLYIEVNVDTSQELPLKWVEVNEAYMVILNRGAVCWVTGKHTIRTVIEVCVTFNLNP
jgi:hypothetical protein